LYPVFILDEASMQQIDALDTICATMDINPNAMFFVCMDRRQAAPVSLPGRKPGHHMNSSVMMKMCRRTKIELSVGHRTTDGSAVLDIALDLYDGRVDEATTQMRAVGYLPELTIVHSNLMRHAVNEMKVEEIVASGTVEVATTILMGESMVPLYPGIPIVCHTTFHGDDRDSSYYNSEIFKVLSIDVDAKTVEAEVERVSYIRDENDRLVKDKPRKVVFELSFDELTKRFDVGFAITAYKAQGKTYDFDFMIADLDTMPKDQRYTSAGRSTRKKHLLIPNAELYKKLQERKKLIRDRDHAKFLENARGRVKSYREQDRKAKRDLKNIPKEDYVDAEFLLEKWIECNGMCAKCERHMTITEVEPSKSRLWEWDRDDNFLPHLKSNGRIHCHDCNSANLE
jgi:hypothetical protein